MSKNNWKDYLLKSGIPLEYEVKSFLDEKKCLSNFEYTYLRTNEENQVKEFSYDIDSAYIRGNHYVQFLIECKYRHESTNWLFLPETYGGYGGTYSDSFLHPIDYFNKTAKFYMKDQFPYELGPLCSKGIELLSDSNNPKTIDQAISQLSYAFAEVVADAFDHQIQKLFGKSEHIFYHIPVIITTANLYRIREDVSIEKIKSTDNIDGIAVQEDCLIIKNKAGINLRKHNYDILMGCLQKYNNDILKKTCPQYSSFSHLSSVISSHRCPDSIVVIHHSKENIGLKKLFKFVDEAINPSDNTLKLIKEKQEKLDRDMDEFMTKNKK